MTPTLQTADEVCAQARLSPTERDVARRMGIGFDVMLRGTGRTTAALHAPGIGPAAPVQGDASLAQPLPPGTAPDWVMVVRTGLWRGHPQVTPMQITEAHLASAVAYFDRHNRPNRVQLVVDYHHASKMAPLVNAPAAGWIDSLEIRGNGTELWGHVTEWTAEAALALEERKFRHVSPVLTFNAPDPVSGDPVPMTIHSVALTNTPFMRELEALNSAGADSAGQPQNRGDANMSLLDTLAAASGKTPEQITVALGLEGGAQDEAVLSAIGAMVDGHGASEAHELVDAAVAGGKVPPATREFWLKAAGADLEGAREALLSMPVMVAPSVLADRKAAPAAKGLTDAEQHVARMLGLTEEKMLAARDA